MPWNSGWITRQTTQDSEKNYEYRHMECIENWREDGRSYPEDKQYQDGHNCLDRNEEKRKWIPETGYHQTEENEKDPGKHGRKE